MGKLDPYRRVEAETIAWSEGLKTEKSEAGMYVTAIHDGDYIRVRNVDFKKGAKSFEAVAASSSSGGQIEIRLDDKRRYADRHLRYWQYRWSGKLEDFPGSG